MLRLKVSPGSIALLAAHSQQPGAADRLREAVRDSDARVRGVAARVANLASLIPLLPEAAAALAQESDPDAAREQIRLLISFGGETYDDAIRAAAARLGLDGELVRMMARVRGAAVLRLYFSTLRELALSSSDRKAFFRLASRGKVDDLTAAASLALGRNDSASWQAILAVATELGSPLDQGVLVSALASENGILRGEAAWYLASSYCARKPEDIAPLLAAVPKERSAPAGGEEDPELRFGAEMLRRVLGKPPVEDEGWIACLASNPDCHLDSDFDQSPLFRYLTPREQEAVLIRNSGGRKQSGGRNQTIPPPDTALPNLQLVTGIPRGAASSLLEIGGCRSNERISLGTLEFRSDGLPRHVWVLAAPKGEWCERIANTLFLLSLAPAAAYVPPDEKRVYLSLYDQESMACGEEITLASAPRGGDPLRVRAHVVAPRLKKKIEPAYPAEARKAGEEGISIYEAVISASGCVRDLKLLKSSTGRLDVLGMRAISRWQYDPATLDGRPVPVYLTVTVTWRLQKRQ